MGTLYNSTQFAEMCGVTPQTVINWMNSGKLVPSTKLDKGSLFSEEQLVDYYKQKLKQHNSPKELILLVGTNKKTLKAKENKINKLMAAEGILCVPNSLTQYFSDKIQQLTINTCDINTKHKGLIFSSFISEYRHNLVSAITNIMLDNYEYLKPITIKEFYDIAIGQFKEEKAPVYNAKIKNVPALSYEHLNEYFYTKYIDIANDYGIGRFCNEHDIRKDILLVNSNLLDIVDILTIELSSETKKANAILHKEDKKVQITEFIDDLSIISKNGYVTIKNIITKEDISNIKPIILRDIFMKKDYETVCIVGNNDTLDLTEITELLNDIIIPDSKIEKILQNLND